MEILRNKIYQFANNEIKLLNVHIPWQLYLITSIAACAVHAFVSSRDLHPLLVWLDYLGY